MLTTVQISLFVLVGYVLREGFSPNHRPSGRQLLTGGAFLISAIASLTLGYAARMQMIKIIDQASLGLEGIETTIARQATFLVLSAIVVVVMIYDALSTRHAGAEDSSKPATRVDTGDVTCDSRRNDGRGQILTMSIVFVCIASAQAHAVQCKQSDFSKKIAALPDSIVVKDDEQPRQALSRALGCDVPPPTIPRLATGQQVRPEQLAGKRVFGAHDEELGVVKGFMVESVDMTPSAVLAPTAPGPEHVAIAFNHLMLKNGKLSLGDTSRAQIAAMAPVNFSSTGAVASFWPWSISDLSELGPQSNFVPVEISSTPEGASVFVSNTMTCITKRRVLLRLTSIRSLRLILNGYKPCLFPDGTFEGQNLQAMGYAKFACHLTTLNTSPQSQKTK